MSVLHARAVALAAGTERDVLRLWHRHIDGTISERRFVAVAATLLAGANQRACSLADLAVTAAVIRHLRDVVPPLGLHPDPVEIDVDRLADVVDGVLAAEIASATTVDALAASRTSRLAITARAEPLTTTQNAMGRAMTEREIPGWTREVSGRACSLCRSLAGVVLPPNARMVRHAGCSCVQTPVFT